MTAVAMGVQLRPARSFFICSNSRFYLYVPSRPHPLQEIRPCPQASLLHAIEDARALAVVFGDLVHAIINQQLSGKAADTIQGRLEAKAGRAGITPKSILKLSPAAMRSAGLSTAKVKAIRNVAKAVNGQKLDLENIHLEEDSKVIEVPTSVKGIGPWTPR